MAYMTANETAGKWGVSLRYVQTLCQKERQVARLAAFGLSNKDIADKLHMSLSGVKQAVRIVSEKTGMRREEFAAIL